MGLFMRFTSPMSGLAARGAIGAVPWCRFLGGGAEVRGASGRSPAVYEQIRSRCVIRSTCRLKLFFCSRDLNETIQI